MSEVAKRIEFDDDIEQDEEDLGVRQVETKPVHLCEGCKQPTASWKFYIRKYVCDRCKTEVPFKTIARSTAMKTFKLTWQELEDGARLKYLDVYKVPNPHARGMSKAQSRFVAPMRLYLFHQVQLFEKQLRKGHIVLDLSKLKDKYAKDSESNDDQVSQ